MQFLRRWRDAIDAYLVRWRRYKLAIANEILDKVDKKIEDERYYLVGTREYDDLYRYTLRRIGHFESLKRRAKRSRTKHKRLLGLSETQARMCDGHALIQEQNHLRTKFLSELKGMGIIPSFSP